MRRLEGQGEAAETPGTPPWEGPLGKHRAFSCTRDTGREGHGHPVSLKSNPSARTHPEPQAGRAIRSPEGQHQESRCLRWTFPPLDLHRPCPPPFSAPSTYMPGLPVLDLSISMVLMVTVLQVIRPGLAPNMCSIGV